MLQSTFRDLALERVRLAVLATVEHREFGVIRTTRFRLFCSRGSFMNLKRDENVVLV